MSEVDIVISVIKVSRGESLSVSLETVDLLNLAAIWKSDVVDSEVVLVIVSISTDLTCLGLVYTVRTVSDGNKWDSPHEREMTLMSVSSVVFVLCRLGNDRAVASCTMANGANAKEERILITRLL